MNNEITLVKRIEMLEATVTKLLDKIIILESLNKCCNCNEINILFTCSSCQDKFCISCCIKLYTKDEKIIYYCNGNDHCSLY